MHLVFSCKLVLSQTTAPCSHDLLIVIEGRNVALYGRRGSCLKGVIYGSLQLSFSGLVVCTASMTGECGPCVSIDSNHAHAAIENAHILKDGIRHALAQCDRKLLSSSNDRGCGLQPHLNKRRSEFRECLCMTSQCSASQSFLLELPLKFDESCLCVREREKREQVFICSIRGSFVP